MKMGNIAPRVESNPHPLHIRPEISQCRRHGQHYYIRTYLSMRFLASEDSAKYYTGPSWNYKVVKWFTSIRRIMLIITYR